MKSLVQSIMVAALAIAVPLSSPSAADAPAPGARPGGGAGTGARKQRQMARGFDPATITTVSGEVTAVDRRQGRRVSEGVHAELKTSDGTLDVHLGPAAYLSQQKLDLAKGDQIEVTGSKVQFGGKPALIAQQVKKGETSITLRDESGRPVWAASGRGPRRGQGMGPGSGAGPGRGPGMGPGGGPGPGPGMGPGGGPGPGPGAGTGSGPDSGTR
jgi:hypothetical protein